MNCLATNIPGILLKMFVLSYITEKMKSKINK